MEAPCHDAGGGRLAQHPADVAPLRHSAAPGTGAGLLPLLCSSGTLHRHSVTASRVQTSARRSTEETP